MEHFSSILSHKGRKGEEEKKQEKKKGRTEAPSLNLTLYPSTPLLREEGGGEGGREEKGGT